MDLKTKKIALAAGGVAAGILTAAAMVAAKPARVRSQPPAPASAGETLRIDVVEPPSAPIPPAAPLDVRVRNAPQVVAAAYAPPARAEVARRAPAALPSRPAPQIIAEPDDEARLIRARQAEDARLQREARLRDWVEQDRRWRDERQAQLAREDQAAWEEAADRRRWEQARDRERYEPYPEDSLPPPPFSW